MGHMGNDRITIMVTIPNLWLILGLPLLEIVLGWGFMFGIWETLVCSKTVAARYEERDSK